MARKRQPRLWDKNYNKLKMEGIKVNKMTPEYIDTLPTLKEKKVIRLRSLTGIEYESEMYSRVFKVLIEKYILHIKNVYKYWTNGKPYDTFVNSDGKTIEASPILTGIPMETLESLKRLSTLLYLVFPNFAMIKHYIEAQEAAQPIANYVNARSNEDTQGFKVENTRAVSQGNKITTEEKIYAMQLENIFHEIKGDDLQHCSVALKTIEFVLQKCVEDRALIDSYNSLVQAHTYFTDYIFKEIVDSDEYKRIMLGKPKPKSEEDDLRERYYIENN